MGTGNRKQMFMLTATPINNSFLDLLHLIELFSQRTEDYFKASLGIHSLSGHFRKMEKSLETATNSTAVDVNADDITEESRFVEDLGFNSYDFMSLLGELENEFDVTVDESDAIDIHTVGEVVKYLEELKK